MRVTFFALLCAALLSVTAQAAIDTYEFDTQAERARYRTLIEQLRCPKCQNQNIADSDAPISLDLRDETYRMMTEEGLSDEQIIDFLVERYGDFVRYKPPVDKRTFFLWYGPFILLGMGLLILMVIILRRRRSRSTTTDDQLTSDEQQRLQQLLNKPQNKAEQ